MKIFDRALLRLTAVYSGILFVICLGFSTVIYSGAINGFDQHPLSRRVSSQVEVRPEVETLVYERDEDIKQQLLAALAIVNIFVLSTGIFISYFLARATLKPISENLKAQAEFVSNASHELRTPLNTMKIENEVLLLDEKATKEDYKNLVDSNLEEIDRLSGLCSRLLSLSRNEKLDLAGINIADVAEETTEKLASVARRKGITIVNKIKKPVKINANYEALSEVITILLENAIKYSPRKSKIWLENNGHKIIVRDEGMGIAKEDLPHIFERFYRAEKSHTTGGHGLGLSLAQHLAKQQNLKITAENNKKKGATFTIS